MQWKDAYRNFCITSNKPSSIAKKGLSLMRPGKVIDLGCGQGRNSFYAASLGHDVTAVDVADVLEHPVRFHSADAMEYDMGHVNGIIATRLLQYLSDARGFLSKAASALSPGGMLMLNYTESGGVFDSGLGLDCFCHKISDLEQMLGDGGFRILSVEKGEPVSTHVPYVLPAVTYDILARRF